MPETFAGSGPSYITQSTQSMPATQESPHSTTSMAAESRPNETSQTNTGRFQQQRTFSSEQQQTPPGRSRHSAPSLMTRPLFWRARTASSLLHGSRLSQEPGNPHHLNGKIRVSFTGSCPRCQSPHVDLETVISLSSMRRVWCTQCHQNMFGVGTETPNNTMFAIAMQSMAVSSHVSHGAGGVRACSNNPPFFAPNYSAEPGSIAIQSQSPPWSEASPPSPTSARRIQSETGVATRRLSPGYSLSSRGRRIGSSSKWGLSKQSPIANRLSDSVDTRRLGGMQRLKNKLKHVIKKCRQGLSSTSESRLRHVWQRWKAHGLSGRHPRKRQRSSGLTHNYDKASGSAVVQHAEQTTSGPAHKDDSEDSSSKVEVPGSVQKVPSEKIGSRSAAPLQPSIQPLDDRPSSAPGGRTPQRRQHDLTLDALEGTEVRCYCDPSCPCRRQSSSINATFGSIDQSGLRSEPVSQRVFSPVPPSPQHIDLRGVGAAHNTREERQDSGANSTAGASARPAQDSSIESQPSHSPSESKSATGIAPAASSSTSASLSTSRHHRHDSSGHDRGNTQSRHQHRASSSLSQAENIDGEDAGGNEETIQQPALISSHPSLTPPRTSTPDSISTASRADGRDNVEDRDSIHPEQDIQGLHTLDTGIPKNQDEDGERTTPTQDHH